MRLRPAPGSQLSRLGPSQQRARFLATPSVIPREPPRPATTPLPQESRRRLHLWKPVPCSQSRSKTVYKTHTRQLSTADHGRPSVSSTGFAFLPHRRQIKLSGPDAPKFLQGLVTHNVDPSDPSSFYTAFLDARGRVLWDAFVWIDRASRPEKWTCWIEVDGAELDAVFRHLKRHKLRSKIDIQQAEGTVLVGWGVPKEKIAALSRLEADGILVMEDPRAEGAEIVRLFDPYPQFDSGQAAPKVADLLDRAIGLKQFDKAGDYYLRRYLLGIAEGPTEIPRESALPMEANFDLNQAIDFKKGCYVGQELTIRTKHTGVVRKRILPVQIFRPGERIPDDQTAPVFDPAWTLGGGEEIREKELSQSMIGADIKTLDEEGEIKKGRSAGRFLAGIGNVGLALCRLEMMTDMRVSAEGGSWRPGMEFGIRVGAEEEGENAGSGKGEVLRVKPFVLDWFKERERALWEKGRGRVKN